MRYDLAGAPPTIFQQLTFAEALKLVRANGLWLVVEVTIRSSATLVTMGDVAWRNPQVMAWVEKNGLAIRLAVDGDGEAASMLEVRGAPTLIAFRAGEEWERVVGLRDGRELSVWLASLRDRTTRVDVTARHTAANALLDDRRYDEATDRYGWLWNNIPRLAPSWKGARLSFMAMKIEALVGSHTPARLHFAAIRDASGLVADWDCGAIGPRVDWIALNRLLGEEERTIDWFSAARAEPRAAPVIESVAQLLIEPLRTRGRWADIGHLYRDPMAELGRTHEVLAESVLLTSSAIGDEAPGTLDEGASIDFRSAAVVLYAGLRAAGRIDEAKAVRQEALRLDPSEGMRVALDQAPVRYD